MYLSPLPPGFEHVQGGRMRGSGELGVVRVLASDGNKHRRFAIEILGPRSSRKGEGQPVTRPVLRFRNLDASC